MKLLLSALLLAPACAFAQQYHLDSTFGGNGIVLGATTAQSAFLQEVQVQTDGRILVSSSPAQVATSSLSMLRFLPDGRPDSAFGTAGVTNTSVSGNNTGNYQTAGMRLTPTGGSLVSGSIGISGSNIVTYKFTSTGAPDASFGNGGVATSNFGFWSMGGDADVQTDGKVVAIGTTITSVYTQAQLRLTAAGAPDITYGTAGAVVNPFPVLSQGCGTNTLASQGVKCILQPDNKLLVAGVSNSTCSTLAFVARYKTNGTPDSSFGTNGLAVPAIGSANQNFFARFIQLDASGNIYVTAAYQDLTTKSVKVIKLNASGNLVTGYGTNGVATATAPFLTAYPYWFGAALQPDGKVVIGGTVDTGAVNNKATAFRFTASGMPDASFGTAGTLTIARSQPDAIRGIAVQSDTSIILVGSTSGSGGSRPLLMRINNKQKLVHTGVMQARSGLSASLFPNPAHGDAAVRIQLETARALSWSVTDAVGQVQCVRSFTKYPAGNSTIALPLSALPAGVYFVRLRDDAGAQTVQRLVVY